MSASRSVDDTFINSIVGPGTFFRGHLELNGLLRIDGDFSGSIKTSGKVIVGQAGRADCSIEASSVVIGGLFRGEVYATEKVILLASSVVIGSIVAPRLVAESGVALHASFRITGAPIDPTSVSFIGKHRKELLLESVRTREGALSGQREREHEQSNQQAPFSKRYERQGQWSG